MVVLDTCLSTIGPSWSELLARLISSNCYHAAKPVATAAEDRCIVVVDTYIDAENDTRTFFDGFG